MDAAAVAAVELREAERAGGVQRGVFVHLSGLLRLLRLVGLLVGLVVHRVAHASAHVEVRALPLLKRKSTITTARSQGFLLKHNLTQDRKTISCCAVYAKRLSPAHMARTALAHKWALKL